MKNKEIQISDIFNDEKMEVVKQTNKDHQLKQREIQLYQLGFKKNSHQFTFHMYKYDMSWYVDFYSVCEPDDEFWNDYLEGVRIDLIMAEKEYYDDLKRHSAYKLHEKQIKQKILDLKNKYKSHLQEETNYKIGKNINFVRETELKAKISVLIELENKNAI